MNKTYQGTVYPWHCDHFGHMNVQFYVEKFNQANLNTFSLLGLSSSYFKNECCGMAAVEQQILYKKELYAGDNVFIDSEVLELGNKSVKCRHVMKDVETGVECAESTIVAVHMDMTDRRSAALPEFVMKNFEKL